jgi:hypothetical protein
MKYKQSKTFTSAFFFLSDVIVSSHGSIYKQMFVEFLLICEEVNNCNDLNAMLWTTSEYVCWNDKCTKRNITPDDLADAKKRNILTNGLYKNYISKKKLTRTNLEEQISFKPTSFLHEAKCN